MSAYLSNYTPNQFPTLWIHTKTKNEQNKHTKTIQRPLTPYRNKTSVHTLKYDHNHCKPPFRPGNSTQRKPTKQLLFQIKKMYWQCTMLKLRFVGDLKLMYPSRVKIKWIKIVWDLSKLLIFLSIFVNDFYVFEWMKKIKEKLEMSSLQCSQS